MKVIIDGEEYIRKKDVEDLIYRFPCCEMQDNVFKKIEDALGFELFTWQKSYITSGVYRRCGKSVAECLRLLLAVDGEPLDFMKPPRSPREEFFRKQLKDIQEKLMATDIPTRTVFWCEADKKQYEKAKRNDSIDALIYGYNWLKERERLVNEKWLI